MKAEEEAVKAEEENTVFSTGKDQEKLKLLSSEVQDKLCANMKIKYTEDVNKYNQDNPISSCAQVEKKVNASKAMILAIDTINNTVANNTSNNTLNNASSNNTSNVKVPQPSPYPNILSASANSPFSNKVNLNSKVIQNKINDRFPINPKSK